MDANDHRCYQRDDAGRGHVSFEVGGDKVRAVLPAGGPYDMTIARAGQDLGGPRDVFVGDLWILAGQSNMQGLGENDGPPIGCDRATMLSFDRTWKPAVEPLHRFWETKDTAQYKMTPHLGFDMALDDLDRMYPELNAADAVSPVGGVGPGAFFAAELSALSNVPLGLIPCALGGSSLDMWAKSFAERHGVPFRDSLYGDLLDRIERAGGRITGVLWYQGESDTTPEWAGSYLERFTAFVDDVRRDTGLTNLPFITVQLATVEEMDWVGEGSFGLVREAQRRAAETIPNVDMVAAADLPRVDHVHLSTEGQRILGLRLARAATRYTGGCMATFSTPRLGSVSRDLDRIDVSFSNLNGGLRVAPGTPLEGCFHVEGAAIASARATRSGVEIDLAGASDDPVRLSYGAGFRGAVALYDDAGFAIPVFGPVSVNEAVRAPITGPPSPDS